MTLNDTLILKPSRIGTVLYLVVSLVLIAFGSISFRGLFHYAAVIYIILIASMFILCCGAQHAK